MFFHVDSRFVRKTSHLAEMLVFAGIVACNAAPSTDGVIATNDPNAGAGGQGGAGDGASGDGGNLFFDGGIGAVDDPKNAACVTATATAERVELDLTILLDRSGSMYGQNWDGTTLALKQFVQDPNSSGINVGILYFPIDNPDDGIVCNYKHYDDLVVPLEQLPGNAEALVASISTEQPNGGSTPMYAALEGALFNATARKDKEPYHKVIVVFASDGDPNTCPDNENQIPVIAGLAKSALSYNGVETYVIAISGASLTNLDQIAAAGGTEKAFDVTSNIGKFAEKMEEIRTKALACEYVIPEPPGDLPLDINKVSVLHVNENGAEVELPKAASAADCGTTPGWYYDDPKNPIKIMLCPASCQSAQADKHNKVDLIFGCEPKLN